MNSVLKLPFHQTHGGHSSHQEIITESVCLDFTLKAQAVETYNIPHERLGNIDLIEVLNKASTVGESTSWKQGSIFAYLMTGDRGMKAQAFSGSRPRMLDTQKIHRTIPHRENLPEHIFNIQGC